MSDPVHISVCVSEVMEQLHQPQSRASSKRGCLVIEQDGHILYSIPWFELDTERKLLFWFCHLADKTWLTRRLMGKILRVIERQRGFDQ